MTSLSHMESKIEASLAVKTAEEIHSLCSELCQALGFDYFLYWLQFPTSFVNPEYVIISGFPEDWWTHYNTQGYMTIDPTVLHCTTGVVPLKWDEINPDKSGAGKRVRNFMSEAWDFGLRSGASFPVHGSNGEAAIFSLVSDQHNTNARSHVLEHLAIGQLLSGYVHEAVRRVIVDAEGPIPKVQLTERERECLTCAAEGKTAWEAAQILTISERTVIFHLQNAAQKLQVTNRPQAVARAVSQQLITPQLGRN